MTQRWFRIQFTDNCLTIFPTLQNLKNMYGPEVWCRRDVNDGFWELLFPGEDNTELLFLSKPPKPAQAYVSFPTEFGVHYLKSDKRTYCQDQPVIDCLNAIIDQNRFCKLQYVIKKVSVDTSPFPIFQLLAAE